MMLRDPRDEISLEKSTMRQVSLRLVPFLMLCYFTAFVDRVNAGFAALQMNKDVGLSSSVFGLGGGIFFIAYFLFEVPSNLALEKVGARVWIARIMITWGLISAAMALVVGPYSFYALRFLLGAAEAGFFPGVILYLTYWFPARYRAVIVAIFMVAIPASSFIGSPISAALLGLEGLAGLHGWQWMFILEGLPAVLLGIVTLGVLRNGPQEVRWLTAEQQAWLSTRLNAERATARHVQHMSLWRVMWNKYVLAAALVYAGSSGASACLSIWQPQIIKSFGLTNMETGFLNALPFGVASVIMVLWGRMSDRTGERVWHTAVPLAITAATLASTLLTNSLLPTIAILCLAVTGTYAIKGPFWALSTEWLSASTAAVGIAQINAIGNLGGFLGTYLLGVIKDATGSYGLGLLPLVALTAAGSIMVLIMGRGHPRTVVPASA
jgi:ACS family tartrate transporter-like MFS transporter